MRGSLAAAALVVGASPALADGTEGLALAEAGSGASSSYLIPEASWLERAAGPSDDSSVRDGAGVAESLARRRPGVFASSPAGRRASAALASGARFVSGMPLASRVVTSGFGLRRHPLLGGVRLHAGIDLAAPTGAPVVATADGIVSTAQLAGGYGLLVAVEHGGGRQTRYAHLSRLNVASGQRVRQGEVIGFVGSTGRSTGPHLHYETRVNGRAVNPRP